MRLFARASFRPFSRCIVSDVLGLPPLKAIGKRHDHALHGDGCPGLVTDGKWAPGCSGCPRSTKPSSAHPPASTRPCSLPISAGDERRRRRIAGRCPVLHDRRTPRGDEETGVGQGRLQIVPYGAIWGTAIYATKRTFPGFSFSTPSRRKSKARTTSRSIPGERDSVWM